MVYSVPNRILVALDQSPQAAQAAEYAAAVLPKSGMEVKLLHILPDLAGTLSTAWPAVAVTPATGQELADLAAQEKRNMEQYLEKIRQVFLGAGFKPEAVTAEVREKEVGYARDIMAEGAKGYGAVVAGRTGMSRFKDIFMGSIATKLVSSLSNLPVWVVGGQPETNQVLIGLDESDGAMRAVDYVGAMLTGRRKARVMLLYASRSLEYVGSFYQSYVTEEVEARLTRQAAELMDPVFARARKRLEAAGLPPENLSQKLVTNTPSRAYALVDEAVRGGYGTIVVGRRGISRTEQFLLGRVSNKVISYAKTAAVWVVN